jgi:hypothetical protein
MTQRQLNENNQLIPENYLWDGFWIDDFSKGKLIVSASFDMIYYQDLMIVFEGVTFFNLPHRWRDTEIVFPVLQFGDVQLFTKEHPDANLSNQLLIALQIYCGNPTALQSFYVVCSKAQVVKCDESNNSFKMNYKDPMHAKGDWLSKENRVSYF